MDTPLIQTEMIGRVRQLCRSDQRIMSALLYGSFAKAEGDEFSDIEFYIFIAESEYEAFDQVEWLSRISPVSLYFITDQGNGVAIFENLIRGEFHFQRPSQMPGLRAHRRIASFPDADSMRIVDRNGEMQKYLDYLSGPGPDRRSKESVVTLYHNFLNSMLAGFDVLARGERARALDTLGMVHRYLLWLVRVHEGKMLNSESRAFKDLEKDLSESAYARYVKCTGSLHRKSLEHAYRATWSWGKELIHSIARKYEIALDEGLIQSLNVRFSNTLKRK